MSVRQQDAGPPQARGPVAVHVLPQWCPALVRRVPGPTTWLTHMQIIPITLVDHFVFLVAQL